MAGEIQLNSVTLATESGGVASIDSSVDIKGPLNASGSAPIYACRAWVNFNGIGTVAIRASGNVSSITDNTTGDYTVNFTTAMPDANYSVNGLTKEVDSTANTTVFLSVGANQTMANTFSTSSIRVTAQSGIVKYDCVAVSISIFR